MTPLARAVGAASLAVAALLGGTGVQGAEPAATELEPEPGGVPVACHVAGLRNSVLCGAVRRPLDPANPSRPSIVVRYVVVPAMARRKLPDPIFLLAGGPGQSAISVAAATMPMFARLNNRRDIVYVDQRGTGRSAPLACPESDDAPLAEQSDPERQYRLAMQCKAALLKLPYIADASDLGRFTTSLAVQDLDAVRAALGAEQLDLVGVSYGTRVALEYQRQFAKRVRRSVLDGVAPPDMALPAAASPDNQTALEALLFACAGEAACVKAHPDLRGRFGELLRSLPKTARVPDALTGREEEVVFTREIVLGAVRSALYVPAFASALPAAIDAASHGDFRGLVGLSAAFTSGRSTAVATGMHLSVVCAEDMPLVASSGDRPGPDFYDSFARYYARLCSGWPRGDVPAAFRVVGPSASPVLVLSGGSDPATPPRHGDRVARALGPMARHIVVAQAGHGVLGIGCMSDVLYRFIDASSDADAMAVDAGCARNVPRAPAFVPLAAMPATSAASR